LVISLAITAAPAGGLSRPGESRPRFRVRVPRQARGRSGGRGQRHKAGEPSGYSAWPSCAPSCTRRASFQLNGT